MRCLALADCIKNQGGRAHFVCSETTADTERRIERGGHSLSRIVIQHSAALADAAWDRAIDDHPAQRSDAAHSLAVAADPRADWVVMDHYALDRTWSSAIRPSARVLVIDDLANRPHDCDILLDQTFGRSTDSYSDLVPQGTDILVGSAFALMRPEFSVARKASLARKARIAPPERILISLGMTDPDGLSASMLDHVLAADDTINIDVVAGSMSPGLSRLHAVAQRNARVRIHIDVTDMAELMQCADLAIGAAGSTSWERCCLGLPSLTLVLAENQRLIGSHLESAGAHRLAPDPASPAFTNALSEILQDHAGRMEMSRRASMLVDGLGTQRVYDAMCARTKGAVHE